MGEQDDNAQHGETGGRLVGGKERHAGGARAAGETRSQGGVRASGQDRTRNGGSPASAEGEVRSGRKDTAVRRSAHAPGGGGGGDDERRQT